MFYLHFIWISFQMGSPAHVGDISSRVSLHFVSYFVQVNIIGQLQLLQIDPKQFYSTLSCK